MTITFISPLPYSFVPNTLADATQVQADFDWIVAQVNANVPQPGKVAVSGNSTFLGYLAQILIAGSGVTLTTLNSGGAETLQIDVNAAQVQLAQIQAAACSF